MGVVLVVWGYNTSINVLNSKQSSTWRFCTKQSTSTCFGCGYEWRNLFMCLSNSNADFSTMICRARPRIYWNQQRKWSTKTSSLTLFSLIHFHIIKLRVGNIDSVSPLLNLGPYGGAWGDAFFLMKSAILLLHSCRQKMGASYLKKRFFYILFHKMLYFIERMGRLLFNVLTVIYSRNG